MLKNKYDFMISQMNNRFVNLKKHTGKQLFISVTVFTNLAYCLLTFRRHLKDNYSAR